MKKTASVTTIVNRYTSRLPGRLAAVLLAVLSAVPLSAQTLPEDTDPLLAILQSAMADATPAALPDIQRANGVDYLSGGIGLDESQAIKAEAARWPLLITMAQRSQGRSEWVADVELQIRDESQALLLAFQSDGPLALIRLAPGKYTVNARYNGMEQQRAVQVATGVSQKITLTWKADPR